MHCRMLTRRRLGKSSGGTRSRSLLKQPPGSPDPLDWSASPTGVVVRWGNLPFPPDPSTGPASRTKRFAFGPKNSPSRFRFRPPLPLTFPFRVLPSDSVSTYLRSVLGAISTLTPEEGWSSGSKRPCPQFGEISLFNIPTAFLAAVDSFVKGVSGVRNVATRGRRSDRSRVRRA
jgi:hypothetical protein